MTIYYTTKGEVEIDTQNYVENMIGGFLINIEKYQGVASPETKNLL